MQKNIIKKLEDFMIESNRIEGEKGLNPADSDLAQAIWSMGFESLSEILSVHRSLTNHLNVPWSGKWRTVNVQVGNYVAPDWAQVPKLMAQFYLQYPQMDSWEAHNAFEKIHPFQDFNGRMGRLIWLDKAHQEGFDFNIPFLQKYYYQTLAHLNQ